MKNGIAAYEMANKLSNICDDPSGQYVEEINGFKVRPGFYEVNGATQIPGGVNFTVHSIRAYSCELLLFRYDEQEPYAVIKFPDNYRIGYVFSMIVFGLDIGDFEYAYRLDGPYEPSKGLIFNKDAILIDPYARAVTGQAKWGVEPRYKYRARVVADVFQWKNASQPLTPIEDLIIYELHVRGYTYGNNSGVNHPGTFEGLREKIPYLKDLGVNAVELMPIFEFDETGDAREKDGTPLLDYWGYNTVSFFAPNTSYSAYEERNKEGRGLKEMIRNFHDNGIEVFLDVVFNHTAEGNEQGRFFSFKGFDNNIYYMLTPEGNYYNYSGCGNTMNCNHPIVQQMILECLRYWVASYRIDGFRFDLATILGRNMDGSPMSDPPLLKSLAFDPILGNVKLIAEAWDAGGLYQVGSFPDWNNRWAEWNGKYRDDLRSFLKGDSGFASAAAKRIAGSPDLYDPIHRGADASVNFLTCHDGFTLYDIYSYNMKHNEANGWDSMDGTDDNRSWNCGVEGETEVQEIIELRYKMIKNACAVLMCSRGTPMFYAGDEFCNTQFGNNNSYCQDNEISWLDWSYLEKNRHIYEFFRYMIAFRKSHECIRRDLPNRCSCGFPNISYHGKQEWRMDASYDSRLIGVMFAGQDSHDMDDIVFLAINAFWEGQTMSLPVLPESLNWQVAVDTGEANPYVDMRISREIYLKPRSVQVLYAKKI